MRYSLYEYYCTCDLSFDGIVNHYISRFYSPKYGENKVMQVQDTVKESKAVICLCSQALARRYAPRFEDFYTCINPSFWSILLSNKTVALELLFAIRYWNDSINSVLHLRNDNYLINLSLQVFKKCKVYESMSEGEFYEFIDKKNEAISTIINPDIIGKKDFSSFIQTYKLTEFESLFGLLSVVEIFDARTGSHHVCLAKDKDGKPLYVEFSAELGDHNKAQFSKLYSKSESLYVGKLPNGKFVLYLLE